LHAFARTSQDDIEAVRLQVQMEVERLRQQEQALSRGRAEHRLAVSEFRQQLIEWQGRIGELKSAFGQTESRLDRRAAALEEATRQAEATTRQLARQAEDLAHQKQKTEERREEMERHLGELRDWYKQKLRELSGVGERPPEAGAGEGEPADPEILS